MIARILVLTLLILPAACASITQLEAPQLEVVDVRMLSGDLTRQQLRVRLRVTNPNDRELPVKGITYKVEVGGEEFASGQSESEFTVPALGTAEFDMSMSANMVAALAGVLSGGDKLDEAKYRLSGRVNLRQGLLRSIPFEKEGSFRLR